MVTTSLPSMKRSGAAGASAVTNWRTERHPRAVRDLLPRCRSTTMLPESAWDGSSVRWMLTCPASWGEDSRSRAGCPDPAGIPGAGLRVLVRAAHSNEGVENLDSGQLKVLD